MKKLIYTAAALAVMIMPAAVFAQSQQLTVPLSSPGKSFKLEAGLISGSITVTAYDGKDIVIDAHSEGGRKEETEHKTGLRRLGDGDRLEINAHENDNNVSVSSAMVNKQTDLIIKVPRTSGVFKISAVNDGNIVVNNANGEFEVINVNGYIRMNNVSGSVVANTVNGDVKVTFRSVDAKAAMAFTTLNGDVDVTFPANFKANAKLKSDAGDIYTDFNLVTNNRQPVAQKSGGKGLYKIKVDDWVYGKIDGGGPQVLMKNMNGSIYIRKSK